MKKIVFILGAAAGYVLGTRAGRERYEQICAQARRLWTSDTVQERVGEAGEAVKKYAPQVGTLAADGVKQVSKLVGSATGKIAHHGDADAPTGTVENPAAH